MNGDEVAARFERLRTRWTFALIAVVWAWIIVPKIVQSILSPKYRNSVGVANASYSRFADLADRGLYLAVIAVCLLIIVTHLNSIDWRGFGLLLCLLLPWAYIAARDVYVPTPLLQGGVCYPLIVTAVWLLKPQLRRLDILGYLVGATAFISVALAVVMPTQGIFRSISGQVIGGDKQIIPGGLLVGVFTQGNNLGQFLALGLPAVFLIRRRRDRLVLAALCVLAVLWSASRGAMLALAIGASMYVVLRVVAPALRVVVGPLVLGVITIAVVVVPLTTTATTAFTNRGLIWMVSLNAWQHEPWFGLGTRWYEAVGASSGRIAGSAFHGHNQLVQFLVTGGMLFVLAVGPQLVAGVIRATAAARAGDLFGLVWLSTLAGTCLLEKSFSYVDNTNSLACVVIPFAFLLLGTAAPAGTGPPGAATSEQTRARQRPRQPPRRLPGEQVPAGVRRNTALVPHPAAAERTRGGR